MKPFDYVKSINKGKNIMRGSNNDPLIEEDYEPYFVNKALSYFPDTIEYANDMNLNYHLPNRPQYEYFINIVRPRNRFEKWVKNASDKGLDIVCDYYKCNRNVGRDYLSLLTSDELEIMKQKLETGGKNDR